MRGREGAFVLWKKRRNGSFALRQQLIKAFSGWQPVPRWQRKQGWKSQKGATCHTFSLSLRAEATYSFISDAFEMRCENRQWVVGREPDSLIKYGLIGKCLSSYSVELWYTYKVKGYGEINLTTGGKSLTKPAVETSPKLNFSVFQYICDVMCFQLFL